MTAFAATPKVADASPYRAQPTAEEEKPMCPVCLTTAALIAGSVTMSGGLAVIALRAFGAKAAAENNSATTPSQPKEDRHG